MITKYKKALGDPVGLAVALVFYCERAAGFCQDVQHQDTAYFDALVRMFEQALKARANLTGNVQNGFLTRLERVRSVGHQLGLALATIWMFSFSSFLHLSQAVSMEIDE